MDKQVSSPVRICQKCNGHMEPGRLMGLKFTSFAADSERNKMSGRTIRVTAYRCENCGYCEIYAKANSTKAAGDWSRPKVGEEQ